MKNFIFAILLAGVSFVACDDYSYPPDADRVAMGKCLYQLGPYADMAQFHADAWNKMADEIATGNTGCLDTNVVEQILNMNAMSAAMNNVVSIVAAASTCSSINDALGIAGDCTFKYAANTQSCQSTPVGSSGDMRNAMQGLQTSAESLANLTELIPPSSLHNMAYAAKNYRFPDCLIAVKLSSYRLADAITATQPSASMSDVAGYIRGVGDNYGRWAAAINYAAIPSNAFPTMDQDLNQLGPFANNLKSLAIRLSGMDGSCGDDADVGLAMNYLASNITAVSAAVPNGLVAINGALGGCANSALYAATAVSSCNGNGSPVDNTNSFSNLMIALGGVENATKIIPGPNLYGMAYSADQTYHLTNAQNMMSAAFKGISSTSYGNIFNGIASYMTGWMRWIRAGRGYWD